MIARSAVTCVLVLWAVGFGVVGEPAGAQQVAEIFSDCDVCPEMVVVPAGSYIMGSPETEEGRRGNEGPQRRVTIAYAFAVGVYEVTHDEWDACVQAGGCGGYDVVAMSYEAAEMGVCAASGGWSLTR